MDSLTLASHASGIPHYSTNSNRQTDRQTRQWSQSATSRPLVRVLLVSTLLTTKSVFRRSRRGPGDLHCQLRPSCLTAAVYQSHQPPSAAVIRSEARRRSPQSIVSVNPDLQVLDHRTESGHHLRPAKSCIHQDTTSSQDECSRRWLPQASAFSLRAVAKQWRRRRRSRQEDGERSVHIGRIRQQK